MRLNKQSLRIFSHGFMRCIEIPVGSNAPFSSAYWNSLRCIMHPSNSPSVGTDAGSRPIMLLPSLYLKPYIWLQPPVICATGVSHFGAPDCFRRNDSRRFSATLTWGIDPRSHDTWWRVIARHVKPYLRVLASVHLFLSAALCEPNTHSPFFFWIEQFLKTFLGTAGNTR